MKPAQFAYHAPTSVVEAGRFVEARCDDRQHCNFIGHIDGKTVDLGPVGRATFRVQPGGSVVAIVRGEGSGETVDLFDAVTTQDQPVHIAGLHEPAAIDAQSALTAVAFLPGGDGVVVLAGSELSIVRLNGEIVARIFVPSTGSAGLLGVGKAGWYPPG